MCHLRSGLFHKTPPGTPLTLTMIVTEPLILQSILWYMLYRKCFVAKTHNGQYIGCTAIPIVNREKKKLPQGHVLATVIKALGKLSVSWKTLKSKK